MDPAPRQQELETLLEKLLQAGTNLSALSAEGTQSQGLTIWNEDFLKKIPDTNEPSQKVSSATKATEADFARNAEISLLELRKKVSAVIHYISTIITPGTVPDIHTVTEAQDTAEWIFADMEHVQSRMQLAGIYQKTMHEPAIDSVRSIIIDIVEYLQEIRRILGNYGPEAISNHILSAWLISGQDLQSFAAFTIQYAAKYGNDTVGNSAEVNELIQRLYSQVQQGASLEDQLYAVTDTAQAIRDALDTNVFTTISINDLQDITNSSVDDWIILKEEDVEQVRQKAKDAIRVFISTITSQQP